MGSLFSAPKVTNRATKTSLNKATSAANSASANINQVSQNAANNISSTGTKYATAVTNAAAPAAAGITSAANAAGGGIMGAVGQYAPGIIGAANTGAAGITAAGASGADALSQLSGNLNQYFTPLGFNAGGLKATYGPNGYTVTPDAARQALINQLYGGYSDAATAFGNLRAQWTPGESALRDAQLASIENARTANISDLRENMAKRAVLGSSFASDAETRANLDYENQKNNVIANTYLQELDAQHQLIGDQYTAVTNAVSSKINELNLEGNLGTQLTTQAQDALKQAAQLKAQLATDAAQLKLTAANNAGSLGLQGATAAGQLGVQGATNAGQLGLAGATAAGQLTTNAATNAGQIATGAAQSAGGIASTGAANAGQVKTGTLTNVANTRANLSAEQAKLDAQAQQGAGALLGTLALAPLTGGTSLLGMGANYLTGNPIIPTAPTGVAGTSLTTPTLFSAPISNFNNGYFYTQPAGSPPVYY